MFFMDIFQTLLIDMGIDLGCGNIGVAEHLLYTTQVGAAGQ